jgi:tetratricopeptide (TPR) repeat protein
MTQQELAEGLVTSSMISQIESNRALPSGKLVEQLAERLGVRVEDLHATVHPLTDFMQYLRKARMLIDQEKYEQAIEILEQLIEHGDGQVKADNVHQLLADCYAKLNQIEKACEAYEMVVQVSIEREDIASAVHAYYNMGNLERRRKRMSVAQMYWTRGCFLLQNYPDLKMPVSLKLHANLSRLYLDHMDYTNAYHEYKLVEVLAKEFGVSSDLAKAYHGLAYCLTEMGKFDEALKYNQLAMQMYEASNQERGLRQCQVNHAYTLRSAKRFDAALLYLSGIVDAKETMRDPMRLANARTERAEVYLALGQIEQAAADVAAARELVGSNSTILCQLHFLQAQIYKETGNMPSAFEELTKSMDCLGPDRDELYGELVHYQLQWLREAYGPDTDLITAPVIQLAMRTVS